VTFLLLGAATGEVARRQGGRPAAAGPVAPAATWTVAGAGRQIEIRPYPSPSGLGDPTWTYFRETGHYISGAFKAYFEGAGGYGTLGYPITEELVEDGWTVQYFQRARFEHHPEAPGAPVQRSLLGDMLRSLRPDGHGPAFQRLEGPLPDGHYFPETGQVVSSPALEFFLASGGPATLGYPISRAVGGVQWFQRARLEWSSGAVQLALIGDEYLEAAGLGETRARAQPPRLARVDLPQSDARLEVFSATGGSERLTRLPPDAHVQVAGEVQSADGQGWYAIRLWRSLDGFVKRDGLAFTPSPLKGPGSASTPWKPAQPPAQGPFSLQATGRTRLDGEFAAVPDGPGVGSLAAGTAVAVTAWATDARGRPWYAFTVTADGAPRAGTAGWILARAILLETPDPLLAGAGGTPLARAVAGKGMWFTYDVLRETPAQHLVATARANGLAFLAPQAGTSRRGYWAGAELDSLLVAAHAAGIKVIPWVYPWLVDLPADLNLALSAARHTAPNSERIDALAVDIEENLDEDTVRAYGQLLRASLGPDVPLIAITYQPQNAAGRRTPFKALSESFNAIAPMSYWHLRNVPHGYDDAYAYVAESVRLIRERTGRPEVPVAILGQTFDWFTRYEIGGGNPTAEEIRGAMQAARDTGALGIGFFNWYSTTPEEWEAIGEFPWP
jgi:hypothetical protein